MDSTHPRIAAVAERVLSPLDVVSAVDGENVIRRFCEATGTLRHPAVFACIAMASRLPRQLQPRRKDHHARHHHAAAIDRRSARRHSAIRTVQRVYGEFHEMPCMRLTAAQARLLFGLRPEVCERIEVPSRVAVVWTYGWPKITRANCTC
jgi:hypothetical protein